MSHTFSVLDSYCLKWYEKIVEFLMRIYILLVKNDLSTLRKIETKTVENSSPFKRISIRD
jgi:hypothetical protein